MTLADLLEDWTDWDGAAYALGRALGVFEEDEFTRVKHVFWTDNDLGNGLRDTLMALTRAGLLERRDADDEQFRWAGGRQ